MSQNHHQEKELIGTVMAIQANYYFVETETKEILCTRRSMLKKTGQKVMVGDRVKVIEPPNSDSRGSIISVLPRKSKLLRPAIANLDHLLLVFALKQPPLDAWQLSRFLVKAESTGIPLTLSLNKADLASESEKKYWESTVGSWGYEPIMVSVTQKTGTTELLSRLENKISILAGPSGVGKSTLINYLIPTVTQRVNTVSGKLNHGRHTTRHVELFPLPGNGLIADSPGFNQPDLHCSPSQVAEYFPEIRNILKDNHCQFSDCLHRDEPNCIVRGEWERYEHYLKFLSEAIAANEQEQQRPNQESTLKVKIGELGEAYYEPKLETKKYRRRSRRSKHQQLQDQAKYNTLAELTEELGEDDDY